MKFYYTALLALSLSLMGCADDIAVTGSDFDATSLAEGEDASEDENQEDFKEEVCSDVNENVEDKTDKDKTDKDDIEPKDNADEDEKKKCSCTAPEKTREDFKSACEEKGKALVCKVPPGNPSRAHNICVGKPAVKAHIKKGSYLGLCKVPNASPTPAPANQ